MYIHEGKGEWSMGLLMSVGNTYLLSLLYFFFSIIFLLTVWSILKHDPKNLSMDWQSKVLMEDACKEFECSTFFHFDKAMFTLQI